MLGCTDFPWRSGNCRNDGPQDKSTAAQPGLQLSQHAVYARAGCRNRDTYICRVTLTVLSDRPGDRAGIAVARCDAGLGGKVDNGDRGKTVVACSTCSERRICLRSEERREGKSVDLGGRRII